MCICIIETKILKTHFWLSDILYLRYFVWYFYLRSFPILIPYYPILQKKSSNLLIKTKEKEKKSKTGLWRIIKSVTRNQAEKHTSGIDDKDSLLVSIS